MSQETGLIKLPFPIEVNGISQWHGPSYDAVAACFANNNGVCKEILIQVEDQMIESRSRQEQDTDEVVVLGVCYYYAISRIFHYAGDKEEVSEGFFAEALYMMACYTAKDDEYKELAKTLAADRVWVKVASDIYDLARKLVA